MHESNGFYLFHPVCILPIWGENQKGRCVHRGVWTDEKMSRGEGINGRCPCLSSAFLVFVCEQIGCDVCG